jgi:hypothetical protein
MRNHSLALIAGVAVVLSAAPTAVGGSENTDYQALVEIFDDFREFQQAKITNGVPDYTPAAVKEQYDGLQGFKQRLSAMATDSWPISQKVDYHLVRAEMNALEFHHKELRPWSRDPGFYSAAGGDAGASVHAPDFFGPLFDLFDVAEYGLPGSSTDVDEQPSGPFLSTEQQASIGATLKALPKLYQQARANLTEPAADLAEFAIRNFRREVELYEEMASLLDRGHPELAADARAAAQAVEDYRQWLAANQHKMAPNAGLGKKNYDWWMRNVQLSPWGWEESNQIIEGEYNRIITFLKLEEHRNRNLPPLPVAMSEKAWNDSLRVALEHVVSFLRDEEIMTIPDWVDPKDYYAYGPRGESGEVDDTPIDDLLPENTSIDTKVRQREILPGETHEYVGHMLDEQRHERMKGSPIRMAERRFNMGSLRLEGWAVALEELLMQAGVLDQRPRKGREMEYLMNASHMSLAIPDMKMHANEINLAEARRLCAEIMPRGWSQEDEGMVWFEMQSNLRNPGGFHSNVVTGKAYFMKLLRETAQALGDDFVLKDFIDEFLASGIIPMSLIRWEMTGNSDDVTLVTEAL